MPLVEVIKGAKTSEPTAQLLMALARKLGKEPILVRRDVPGFVGNRLQFAVFREALDLVQRGIASPQDVDTAMKSGPGLRYAFLGPLQTADLGGLDVFSNISRYLFGELCRDTRPPPCLTERVKARRFGVKSASGFYEYRGRRLEELLAERDQQLIKLLKVLRRGRVTKESTR
jgi:3-hydroxybutyryl-CoA dehydrogenase